MTEQEPTLGEKATELFAKDTESAAKLIENTRVRNDMIDAQGRVVAADMDFENEIKTQALEGRTIHPQDLKRLDKINDPDTLDDRALIVGNYLDQSLRQNHTIETERAANTQESAAHYAENRGELQDLAATEAQAAGKQLNLEVPPAAAVAPITPTQPVAPERL